MNDILLLEDFKHKQNLDSINLLWRALMSMDILEVYTLLKDDYSYNKLTRTEFVSFLDGKFKKHKVLGDSEFYLSLHECYKCHEGEIICQFVGLDSGIGLGLYFDIKNAQIAGIQFCDAYGQVEDLNEYYNWDEI
ncbi:MAG: hypothetical protein RQ735_00660 [Flavobacteriaceae bacterium]|nr:hypothetical protein [Flavobacteriaceae bacterium]